MFDSMIPSYITRIPIVDKEYFGSLECAKLFDRRYDDQLVGKEDANSLVDTSAETTKWRGAGITCHCYNCCVKDRIVYAYDDIEGTSEHVIQGSKKKDVVIVEHSSKETPAELFDAAEWRDHGFISSQPTGHPFFELFWHVDVSSQKRN